MNRVTARTHAMKLIYEWEMGGEGGEDTRINLLGAQPGEEEYAFMERMFQGISRVDLAILRLATCELMQGRTPQAVVINEAVEMARQYSGEKSPQFVHGVLGSISRSLAQ